MCSGIFKSERLKYGEVRFRTAACSFVIIHVVFKLKLGNVRTVTHVTPKCVRVRKSVSDRSMRASDPDRQVPHSLVHLDHHFCMARHNPEK